MTEPDLLAANYHQFYPNKVLSPYAARGYQRAVWEDDKKAYFVRVYFYDVVHFPNGASHGPSFEADATLYLPGDRRMTLKVHDAGKMTVEMMEAIFFAAWAKLGCIHDPHNN